MGLNLVFVCMDRESIAIPASSIFRTVPMTLT